MFRAAVAIAAVSFLACGVSQSEVTTGDTLATEDAELRKKGPCMTVRCAAGYHCVAKGNKASCEPDDPPALDCSSVLCITGTVCENHPSGPRCVPQPAECTTDADCRLEANYCGGCSCLALATGESGPSCSDPVQCFAEPCSVSGNVASCVNGQCAATAAPAGEKCGDVTCASGQVCCNASCGICTPPGYSCIQLACQ
jgi:hypothetical protein